ncbi:8-oxoguanine DNA glycosylase [archaeon]|nr:8-oxoguanine DNA glycosylase [archaeon]
MEIKLSGPFSLEHTLLCGQFFRYRREHHSDGDWFFVMDGDKLLKVRQQDSIVEFEGIRENGSPLGGKDVISLFSLDHDLPMILEKIQKDDHMRAAVGAFPGLRVMRQDPWQCLVSFMCSSNANIPQINRMTSNIAMRWGTPLELDGFAARAFPTREQLASASLQDLLACGLGFRAKFVHKLCQNPPDFAALREMPYPEAHVELMKTDGVAEKIADCVSLFALEKMEAFPTDVWIERAVRELYFDGQQVSTKKAREFGRQYFGEHAGYAQEYLYYWRRTR